MLGQGWIGRNLWGHNVRIIFSILSKGGTKRLVCTLPRLVGVNLEVGVMFLIRRIPKPCSGRLIVCEGGYAANDGEGLLQALTFLLMIGMSVIDPGQELLPVSLSRVMRTIITSAEIGAHLAKA